MIIQSGFYQHFKGAVYPVIGIAKHTETEENLVIYRGSLNPLDEFYNKIYARPLYSFIEDVNGIARFRKIR